MPERAPGTDAPDPTDPEDVLSGARPHRTDHEPADPDDREVVLDEPDEPSLPAADD